jgi:hypothetical protein
MDHVVPFHTSARGCWLCAVKYEPTATQALAEVHATPLRDPPGRAGVRWIDHDLPSHTSAKGPPPTDVTDPTAMQNVADVQETPDSPLMTAPGGLGVFSTDHEVPFPASASVTCAPVGPSRFPTAIQALGEVQETADSCPWGVSGLGVGWTAQARLPADAPGPGWRAAGPGAALAAGTATPARVRAAAAAAATGAAANEPAMLLRAVRRRVESAWNISLPPSGPARRRRLAEAAHSGNTSPNGWSTKAIRRHRQSQRVVSGAGRHVKHPAPARHPRPPRRQRSGQPPGQARLIGDRPQQRTPACGTIPVPSVRTSRPLSQPVVFTLQVLPDLAR